MELWEKTILAGESLVVSDMLKNFQLKNFTCEGKGEGVFLSLWWVLRCPLIIDMKTNNSGASFLCFFTHSVFREAWKVFHKLTNGVSPSCFWKTWQANQKAAASFWSWTLVGCLVQHPLNARQHDISLQGEGPTKPFQIYPTVKNQNAKFCYQLKCNREANLSKWLTISFTP